MLVDHGGDFECLAIGLRALLKTLPVEFQAKRAGFIKMAKAKWYSIPRQDQDEWLNRLENARMALLTKAFNSAGKFLEMVDALFQGPPASNQTCALTTAGSLMAMAHAMWLPFSKLKAPTDHRKAWASMRRGPCRQAAPR